jgi:hypothetical protein
MLGVVAAGLVVLLAAGHLYAVLHRPVDDEADIALSAGQAMRVLHGQLPFEDYVPAYGPTQQYVAAVGLAVFGQDVRGARLTTLVIAVLSGVALLALFRTLPAPMRPGWPMSIAACAFAVVRLSPDLTPQGTYMMVPGIALCAVLVLRHVPAQRDPGSTVDLWVAVLAGLATAFCAGAKPHVGMVLAFGTILGLMWPGQTRRSRLGSLGIFLAALAYIGLTRNPGASGPYLLAPVTALVFVALGSAPLRSVGQTLDVRVLSLYGSSALLGTLGAYITAASGQGQRNLMEWVERMSRAGQAILTSPMDDALRFNLWTLGLLAVAIGCYWAVRLLSGRFAGGRVLAVAGLLMSGVAAAHLLARDVLSSLSLSLLWVPTCAIALGLLHRAKLAQPSGTEGPIPPAVQSIGTLLPLVVGLLISAFPSATMFDAFVLPLVLCAGWLQMAVSRNGPVLPRRAVVTEVIAGGCLALAVAHISLPNLAWSTLHLAQTVDGSTRLGEALYRVRHPGASTDEARAFAKQYTSADPMASAPDGKRTALAILEAEGAQQVFCFPYPLPVLAVPGTTNVSGIDYWYRPYLTQVDLEREAARLGSPQCQWVYAERWPILQLSWREQRHLNPEQRSQLLTLAPRDVLRRYFSPIHEQLRSGQWRLVHSSPSADLWRREPACGVP